MDEDFEGVDLEAAMDSVIEDMGKTALEFKAKRYAPKPKAPEQPAPEPEQTENGPTLNELESLLTE